MQLVSPIRIRWIVIYPVDSAIQRLNNRGLSGRRKRFLVRKETSCLPFAVHLQYCITILFLFQAHLFILWQNSRIVALRLKVIFTNSLLNSVRSQLLAFPFLLWNEGQGRLRFIVEAECFNMSDFKQRLGSGHNYTQSRNRLQWVVKWARVFMWIDVHLFLMKNTSILRLYSLNRKRYIYIRKKFLVPWQLIETLYR